MQARAGRACTIIFLGRMCPWPNSGLLASYQELGGLQSFRRDASPATFPRSEIGDSLSWLVLGRLGPAGRFFIHGLDIKALQDFVSTWVLAHVIEQL